jgi:predicted metal-dependent hydrolase
MIHPHKIIYSSRRTLALEVKSTGQVLVRSPKRVGLDYIQKFVAGRQDWLSKVIEKMSSRKVVLKPWSNFSGAELQQAKKQAKALFEEELRLYSTQMNCGYTKLRLSSAKTRWGSCSSSGTISINFSLYFAPIEIRHYVIIHELAHVKHPNHSPRFWNFVHQFDPNWKLHRSWLKQHGSWLG